MRYRHAYAVILSGTLALGGCQPGYNPQESVGTAVGGIAGGLLGSRFGHGSGQVAAAATGAVAGGLVGGAMGRSMGQTDRGASQASAFSRPTGTRQVAPPAPPAPQAQAFSEPAPLRQSPPIQQVATANVDATKMSPEEWTRVVWPLHKKARMYLDWYRWEQAEYYLKEAAEMNDPQASAMLGGFYGRRDRPDLHQYWCERALSGWRVTKKEIDLAATSYECPVSMIGHLITEKEKQQFIASKAATQKQYEDDWNEKMEATRAAGRAALANGLMGGSSVDDRERSCAQGSNCDFGRYMGWQQQRQQQQ